jgi:photosystem II stability/assembly factor-like uncharacterized protein
MRAKAFWSFFLVVSLCGLVGASAAQEEAEAPGGVTTDDLDVFAWRHIGPFTFSGRITDFAVPGGQSQIYYVATASGGLWKTEDGGISFAPIFDQYGNMSMGNVEVAPSDHNIVYLGTGEAMHARSSAHGNGMWKSTDAGKTWTRIGLEETHYIPKIAIDPRDPDIVYVAAEGKLYSNEMDCQRGLFKTTDGGQTWDLVLDLKDRGVGDFVIDPRNSDIVIAGAYKTYRRSWTFIDRQPGNHFYKTTDGGQTWKKLTDGLPQDIKSGWSGLTIYPKNPDTVFIRLDEVVNLGLSERENAARFRARRTFADGAYFSQFKSFEVPRALARMVTFEPITAENEEKLVEKLNEFIDDPEFQTKLGIDLAAFNQKARQVYKNDDEILESITEIGKVIKAYHDAAQGEIEEKSKEEKLQDARRQTINRHILEMLYGGKLQTQQPIKKAGVIYRSDDLGETWTAVTEYKQTGGSAQVNDIEAGYAGRIEVDPNDDNVLYAVETYQKISRDGGKTFKNAPWFGNGKCHVDVRGIWIDPLNSNHILCGNDGGVSQTWDGGKHWSQKETISAQQFYDISVDNEMPYNVMGGTQDNGCWIGPSRNRNQYGVFPADWTYLPSGDGYYVLRDWWNPEWIYYESQFGRSSRMNLKTGESISLSVRNTAEENEAGKPAQRYQWDSPIHLSPHNPGIVYVCSQHVHRSMNRGESGSWQTISPDLSRSNKERLEESKLTNLQYATVYTFAESPVKPGVYWAGTDDGNLQLSRDGGDTWTNITFNFYDQNGKPKKNIQGDLIPFDHWVTRVEPSAHDLATCYVTWSGYRTHDEDNTYVFVTTDFGKTWKDLSNGMMNPARDIEEDPDNPDVLYLATDYGIFVTLDRGGHWVNMSHKAPDVIIMDLDIQKRDRDLAVATYGRGFYIVDISPFKEMKAEMFGKEAFLFEPQHAVKWLMRERRGQSYGEFAKVPNPNPGADIYYYLPEKAKKVMLVVKGPGGGETVQEVRGSTDPGLKKVTWNLRKRVQRDQQQQQQARRRGGAPVVDAGLYKVTLLVDDEEIATKDLKVIDDPILK